MALQAVPPEGWYVRSNGPGNLLVTQYDPETEDIETESAWPHPRPGDKSSRQQLRKGQYEPVPPAEGGKPWPPDVLA